MPNKPLSLIEWLEERRQNALAIAKTKSGDDRAGWIEDASYFARAEEAVREFVKLSERRTN
jgi:hypothetical protein